jgi:hypothetical protein
MLCTLSSRAKKQGERNCEKHTLLMTFGLKRLALVRDTHLSGRLGWSRWNYRGRLCSHLLHFGNRAVPTGGRSICLNVNDGEADQMGKRIRWGSGSAPRGSFA